MIIIFFLFNDYYSFLRQSINEMWRSIMITSQTHLNNDESLH